MKKVFKIVIIMALTFITIQVEKDFKNRSFFNVSKVQINEVSKNLQEDLERIKIDLLGKNVNDLNLKNLEEKISKDARIKKVEISKQKLNEITIDVTEKESSYYIQYKNRIYSMDEDGVIFGMLEEYPRRSMPILLIKSDDEKLKLLEVIQKLKELDLKEEISQIYMENKNLIFIILRDGTRVKTQTQVSKSRYKTTMNLYKEMIKTKNIEYIDVRFKDILIKEKEGKDAR